MKNKILEIFAKNKIPNNTVEEIIIKPDKIIASLNISQFKDDKSTIENNIKICESEIKKELKIEKTNIILTNGSKADLSKQTEEAKPLKKNLLGQEILPVIGVKKIIAIASAKGGVGKSTIATNIAISLSKIGHKIALVDADIYGPSISHLMNIDAKPEIANNLLNPLIANNIKSISVANLIDKESAGVWRGPMITKILYQLIRSVNWQFDKKEVDIMVIDMPPGTGDVYLSLAEKFPLDGVVMISTPQSLAVIDVVRSIDCFKKLQIPIIGLIQNMSYLVNDKNEKSYIFGKDNAKNLAQEKQINFLGELPLNQEISDSTENRIPFTISNPNSLMSLEIGKIAEKILDYI